VTIVVEIEVVRIKALNRHIERLEAKLSFLIRSYDDDNNDNNDNNNTCTHLSDHQYKKKIGTIKQEIDDAMERRRTSNRLEQQISVIRYSIF
jgi:low affinity Fe/Cu permease